MSDPRARALHEHADVVLDALWERLSTAEAHLMGLDVPTSAGEPEVARMHAAQARAAIVAILRALGRDDEAEFVATQTGTEGRGDED